MINNKSKKSLLVTSLVIVGDLLVMNGLLAILYRVWPSFEMGPVYSGHYWELLAFNTLCYILSVYHNGVVLYRRKVRNMHIVGRVTKNCLKFGAISIAFIALAGYEAISTRFMMLFYLLNYVLLIIWRIGCNKFIRYIRSKGRNSLSCVYIGSGKNIRELYKEMQELASGYRVLGYFDHEPNGVFSDELTYLGKPEEAIAIEDSFNGIRSAYAAGMTPVMVPDIIGPDEEMREKSHKIFNNLLEVKEWLEVSV
jgi:putative colanic acid biosynthesis UDP-glucose lipid carrier transferase